MERRCFGTQRSDLPCTTLSTFIIKESEPQITALKCIKMHGTARKKNLSLVRSSSTEVLKFPSGNFYFIKKPLMKGARVSLKNITSSIIRKLFNANGKFRESVTWMDFSPSYLNLCVHTGTHTHTLLGKTSAWHACWQLEQVLYARPALLWHQKTPTKEKTPRGK